MDNSQHTQDEPNPLIESQNLILETMKFVLDSSVNIQNKLDTLSQKVDNLSKMSQSVNNLKNQIDKLSIEMKDQKNYIKQLVGNLKNEHKQSIEKLTNQSVEQINKLEKSITKIKSSHTELSKQINNVLGSNDSINENLLEMKNIAKLTILNQIINKPEKIMPSTNEVKNSYSDFEICKIAAESHNVDAMYKLAMMYFNGSDGAVENKKTAFEWFQKAAINGNTLSMKMLSDCYKNGWGTTANKQNADYWQNKLKGTS